MTNNLILKLKKEKKYEKLSLSIVTFIILLIASFFVIVPFYMIIITSFKTEYEALLTNFTWWPMEGFSFAGYYEVLVNDATSGGGEFSTILRGFLNTLIIVVPATLVGLFTSSLSAYAFAKMRFPLKNLLFNILLVTMMIPGIIMLIPSYVIYDTLNLTDTYFPLMAPGMFGSAACVFFMRQYFYGIPTDLIESGKLDGLSYFMIFIKIMVPLSGSGLIAQGVLGFVGGYNDYMGPMIYIKSTELNTLQIALNNLVQTNSDNWPTVMAGAVIALIPTTLIYIFAQRFFIEGIATTGLKA